jgi:uncharacterized coiled-coil protein SlyX
MEERIIKLETLSAMQDETITTLNHELFRQQQDILQLQRRIESLEQKLAEFAPADEVGGNEKPPHY